MLPDSPGSLSPYLHQILPPLASMCLCLLSALLTPDYHILPFSTYSSLYLLYKVLLLMWCRVYLQGYLLLYPLTAFFSPDSLPRHPHHQRGLRCRKRSYLYVYLSSSPLYAYLNRHHLLIR